MAAAPSDVARTAVPVLVMIPGDDGSLLISCAAFSSSGVGRRAGEEEEKARAAGRREEEEARNARRASIIDMAFGGKVGGGLRTSEGTDPGIHLFGSHKLCLCGVVKFVV